MNAAGALLIIVSLVFRFEFVGVYRRGVLVFDQLARANEIARF